MNLSIKRITNLLLFFAIATSGILKAQITITNNNMPVAGDTLRHSIAVADGSLDFSLTGADYNWDFSSLKFASQDIFYYKALSATPYSFYPKLAGTVGLKTADSVPLGITTLEQLYTFYKTSASSYTATATGFIVSGFPLASLYTDPDIIYNFPMKFNNSHTDHYSVKTSIPTIGSFKQEGDRNTTVEGWGKISTPYGANIPCLKIKAVKVEIDSLITSFFSFGIPVSTVTYTWLSAGEKIPLLEVTGTEFGGTFTPGVMRYRDSSRIQLMGIRDLKLSSNSIYPNPAKDKLFFKETISNGTSCLIYDVTGRVVLSGVISDNTLNIETLAPGTYQLFCLSTSGAIIRSFIKE
ncbi:MAG: T9SS type A sorting domain-containing protein [Bacteroidia bacterium]|nr:T9SS type A sorting domain-containing protein [Bacteroidia bacterium]